jgi:hypothetical protein
LIDERIAGREKVAASVASLAQPELVRSTDEIIDDLFAKLTAGETVVMPMVWPEKTEDETLRMTWRLMALASEHKCSGTLHFGGLSGRAVEWRANSLTRTVIDAMRAVPPTDQIVDDRPNVAIVDRTYRHYKGRTYRVVCRSLRLDESGPHVVLVTYCMVDLLDSTNWTRTEAEFFENVKHDGKTVRRFELVERTSSVG